MTVKHPAPYTPELISQMAQMLGKYRYDGEPGEVLYDPMAGSGERLARLAKLIDVDFAGSEIEPEFIVDSRVKPRNCLDYFNRHPVIVTSPAYGNRMADQYLGTPKERAERELTGKMPRRRSYAIALGRKLTVDSGARVQWGGEYQVLHEKLFGHVVEYNMADLLLLNVASHFRGERYAPVAEWYLQMILGLDDLVLCDYRFVETPGFRDGQNRELRVGGEHLMLFKREG